MPAIAVEYGGFLGIGSRKVAIAWPELRFERGSTIVTSQLPVEHWHEIIGDPTLADAILDRLVHNAHRLNLKGESLRKAAAKRQKLDADPTK